MNPGAAPGAGQLIGRETELMVLDRFLSPGAAGRCLVLVGDAGIGKTTLWEAGTDAASARGFRLLRARASETEAKLSYVCLADLLDGIELSELADLPAPQRAAVEVALRRAESSGAPPEGLAISAGLLNAMRALAVRDPLLVAVDDITSVDPQSIDALAYAARRLADSTVRFLVSRRTVRPTDVERAFAAGAVQHLEIGPLSFGATNHLLRQRLGRSFPRRILRRIFETAQGNPLFALELGRTLVEHGMPEIGADLPLPDLVEDLFGARVAELHAPVRRVLLAVALGARVTWPELVAVVDPIALEDAVESGVVAVERLRVRPSHPLLAAAATRQSSARERRDLHRDLAAAFGDPALRARHLALAATAPDPELAAMVAGAAAAAGERGAVQEAVELAAHALRLTPRAAAEHGERVLALARRLQMAGDYPRATELLTAHLDTLPPGRSRAAAHLLLAEETDIEAEEEEHVERAIAESAADPELHAVALAWKAMVLAVRRLERLAEAEALVEEAMAAAPFADVEVERRVLVALAWTRVLRGRPIDDLVRRAPAESAATTFHEDAVERPDAVRRAFRGEIAAARTSFGRQLSLADERGHARSGAVLHLQTCELALREGDALEAVRLLDEWDHWTVLEEPVRIPRLRLEAVLSALRGDPERTRQLATELMGSSGPNIVGMWDRLEATRAIGIAALLERDAGSAVESLRSVWEHTVREGVDDPGTFPVAADLVEALVESADIEAAAEVTDVLRRRAIEQDHPWGLATAQRCAAVVRLADGYVDEAAAALGDAVATYMRLGLRFDGARSLLFLGRIQRRFKKRAEARRSLAESRAAFERLGCDGWAEEARSELARVSGRRSVVQGELTLTERRVVELAASGLSNKEIAGRLFVTVYTVEAHLSHAYGKLGIRSRSQLGRRLANPTAPQG